MLERPFDVERVRSEVASGASNNRSTVRAAIDIIIPRKPEHWDAAGEMARELIAWIAERAPLDPDTVLEPMLQESRLLHVLYAEPRACFLMALTPTGEDAEEERVPAGITAVRLIEPGVAELKRVWVRPSFRGRGIASILLDHAIEHARAMFAHTMRLETAPAIMPHAHAMYKARGFRVIDPYSGLALHAPDVVAMELPIAM